MKGRNLIQLGVFSLAALALSSLSTNTTQYSHTLPGHFLTQSGAHPFDLEIAASPSERERGLMYRLEIRPPDWTTQSRVGMLFVFPDSAPRTFWMLNTPLSLDIIFLDSDLG